VHFETRLIPFADDREVVCADCGDVVTGLGCGVARRYVELHDSAGRQTLCPMCARKRGWSWRPILGGRTR
jgi:hypothetical protein